MKTEAGIRILGMQALINTLGLVEAERFLVAVELDKFNYTEWRRSYLPDWCIEEIADNAQIFRTIKSRTPLEVRMNHSKLNLK